MCLFQKFIFSGRNRNLYIPTLFQMDCLKHLEEVNKFDFSLFSDDKFRYEFTVTFNPKHIFSIEYAESLIDDVIKDVFRLGLSISKVPRARCESYEEFLFNYVVEYHQNGYPHVHGTLCVKNPIKPITLANWEAKFKRKYGRTDVYATGMVDKVHNNDHFSGTWQEYLEKENKVSYYVFRYWYTNAINPIKVFFK